MSSKYADLFLMNGIVTFPENKSCYKAVTNFQKKDASTLY